VTDPRIPVVIEAEVRRLAVDALYEARDAGHVMDEAAWRVAVAVAPVIFRHAADHPEGEK